MERIEEFIEALKEKGIRIWSDNEKLRYQAAKGAMDSQTLEKIKEKKVEILEFLNNKSDIEVVFKSNQAERYEPFPLTNIQNSYVIGRNSAYELGDVTCHGYIEITYQEELDKEKLEMAWNKVIAKHDMLRAIIYENGYQRVQKDVPEVKIESYDLRTCSEDEQLLNLQNIRANYAEKQYPLGQWPMCDIVLSLWKGKSIIHFSLDMLITDFMSANLILNDLDNYYHGKAVEVKVETLYRDIVLYNQRKSMSKSKERKKAERYWQDKIRNMGTAPELIINNQKTGERETFKQLKFFIDEEGKENINEIAKELRVTASTVILTAFGEVINKWSKNSKFSINMTMLSRDKTIPGVDKVVGDFTDVNVYSMDYSSCKSFESRILENQVSLWEDLQNNAVSGIEVLRELGREKKENVMIPIVYTSTLGVSDSDNSFLSRSNISYKISQTPQVWIDCQIAEENGGVAVNWDYRTGVFLQNVIRDMFEAFERVLKRLGKKDNTVLKETDPIGLPEKTQAVRNKVNATERELPESLMAEGFVKSCVLYPNKTALITKDGEYTYAALKQYVSAVQHTLLENGLKPGDSAAVMLPKGIWQIAGVLGTLLAGGVYLPIDSKQPLQRRNDIIQDSGVKFVLTEKVEELYNQEKLTTINVNILDATTEYQLREIAGVRGSDPAYIIYTSGTTGKPKGVVISHEAAMNTIYDVIERFSLNRETVILGLSNLAFDLSVFDIFGCFQVGGTLVLPDDELKKNPKHILDLIIINRVTVLNAVPAQMKMLDSYMDNAGILEISWVKLIIMSGDWIPVGLPENLFKKFTNAIVGAGVGGTSVDVIPSLDGTGAEYYFTDLSAFFLNNAREKFSGYEWVKYNIFDINKDIMEQTIAPFSVDIILAANVLHNAKNIHYVLENLKKLLKPNGTIIILEETLEAYTLLTSMEFKDGLTGFTDERAENNQTFFKREQWEGVFKEHKADIVYQFPEKGTPLEMAGQTIYVVRFKENYICPDKNNMLDELERRIPEYMIPSVITFLPRLPQTSNDKIDRGRISKWISASAEENKKVDVAELPQNDLEEQIARIWCKELNIERIGRNDNFYLSGGDSLLIAQVIARMRETIEAAKRWSWDDLLKEMMKTPTIRGVAKILSNQAGENEQDKSLVIIKEAAESSEKKVTVVFHAGTGTLTPYNSLIAYITERSQENEAVMGFTFGDEAEYLAIPTDKIFENLGKKYGRILSELGFTEYTLIGHCVGGLIALETAHYLKDKGKNVSSVTLLSTSIPHKKEETVLADLDMKIFETAVQTSLYNELLLERTFASLIDADIKKAGHQVDNDTLQQVIEYLIFNNGGNITVQALCSLTGKFAEVGAEFQRLHSMSATERMNDLYTTIERPNGQLMEHQRKMLNVLFRVFAQNFRCVSSYIPKVYTGKMRVFDCESAIANFFPSLFSEDKKTWEQYAQGEFLFDTMKGDHISCMNSPYIEENVKKILDL